MDQVRRRSPVRHLPQATPDRLRGTWRDARPGRIEAALADALARPTHGWVVVGASGEVPSDTSVVRTVGGREVVLWRDVDGSLLAGPGACPHLGARLDACPVVAGDVRCRWHGMPLGRDTDPPWATVAAYDDGVLLWARLGVIEDGVEPTDRPVLATRPAPSGAVASVVALPVTCEPRDIVANRLDPWHGAWFHPYAFSDLTVDDDASTPDRLVLDVAYRLDRRFAVPVRAEFTCPDAQTVVMTITEGEGLGSVVETHATLVTAPGVHPARTVMTEAVVATSDRVGFRVARGLAPLVRMGMRASQRQLWTDDLEYAARRYALRRGLVG
ncbi:Rieske 2Fe-2S domain-containing protein [Phycicoccus sp. CMS6Z-2]|uniref:Rieske 2Fe-2S domain-containing protein n=1 Tax=Phycicoccus flavus TaxID=2502783 RepID=A0A8T6R126_9MICO|nr:Rieske 2Fe-2S domain-containing protein [Phycicoccus flavus]